MVDQSFFARPRYYEIYCATVYRKIKEIGLGEICQIWGEKMGFIFVVEDEFDIQELLKNYLE